jgi:hypothetical protein
VLKKGLVAGAVAIIMTALAGDLALADTINDAQIGGSVRLDNASPATEQAWLESLLDGTKVTLVGSGSGGSYSWDYAVVKKATDWTAYADSINDNVLVINGQSVTSGNIRYFQASGGPYRTVPEPSALLLLGAGLLAVTPFGWALRRRG